MKVTRPAAAEEKANTRKKDKRRRQLYQIGIFLLCYTLGFINRLREEYLKIWKGCVLTSKESELYCNDFEYSVMISSGIGFIFLGNIYDNIEKPR